MNDNIEVLSHSSIRIVGRGTVVYFDPFEIREERHDATAVFITHDHYDHFSPEDIEKIATEKTVLVCPERMLQKAKAVQDSVKDIIPVKPGMFIEISGMGINVIPAYNILKPFHPKKSEWCGYVVNLESRRIYVAGDTDATKEAKAVKCDIALVPIGGTYTMDPKSAAELINTIRPEIAIPTHYGSIVGKMSMGEEFKKLVLPSIKVELKIKEQ